jgi:arsenate reductase (glutaredoxin)
MATTVYGIKNCDTIKKARAWLEKNGVEYTFHDVRSDGLDETTLRSWVKSVGWETLLNTRGTTWRKLPEQDKAGMNEGKAVKLVLSQPSIIKRPVLKKGKQVQIGFKEDEYKKLFL